MAARRLDAVTAAALLGLLAFVLVSLPLAMLGWFRPVAAYPLAVGLWLVFLRVWYSLDRDGERTTETRAIALAAIALLAITGVNVRFASQRVLTEKDPGVYITTARWLANEGTLLIDPQRSAYRDQRLIHYRAAGYYEGFREDGKLYAQFVHGLPVVIGGTAWVAGSRGMMKTPAILGGLALLVFYAFASRFLTRWWALGATVALGASLPQLHFSRDAYTEVLAQLLLFGAIWFIWLARPLRHPGGALIGGLLLGSTLLVRVDAFVFLVPFAVYLYWELWQQPQDAGHRAFVGALAAGATAAVLIAWLDVRFFSPVYLRDLWAELRLVGMVLLAVVFLGALVVLNRTRVIRVGSALRSLRPALAWAGGTTLVGGGVYAYVLRPHFERALHNQRGLINYLEKLQRREGIPIDGHRLYSEFSLRWLGLYIGVGVLFAGIVGCALLWAHVIRGTQRHAVPFLLMFSSMSALYVWAPNVTPDHLWALRRFVPITIPGLVLCGFWLMKTLWERKGHFLVAARALAVALAIWGIAFPIWTVAPVWTERTQLYLLGATEKLCRLLPEDAAVLVAQSALLDLNYTQSVRSFCSVPAATAPMDQPFDWYRKFARRWEREGYLLYVVAPRVPFGTYWPSTGAQTVADFSYRELERSLTGRPTGYETFIFRLYLMRVSAA